MAGDPGAWFRWVIASSGAHIDIAGHVVTQPPLSVEDVRAAVEFLDGWGMDYYLNAASGTYMSPNCAARARELLIASLTDPAHVALVDQELAKHQAITVFGADLVRDDVTKICFLDSGVPRQQIEEALGDRFVVTGTTVVQFGPDSGELLAKGSGKVPAIRAVLAQFDIPVEDTIAYGDGLNDLEMLRYVHIGVAMGNAHPHLKDAADQVTGTPDEHGIRTSFTALGLI